MHVERQNLSCDTVTTDRILLLLHILLQSRCSTRMSTGQPYVRLCTSLECSQRSYWCELLCVFQLSNILKTVHQVETDRSDQEIDDKSP